MEIRQKGFLSSIFSFKFAVLCYIAFYVNKSVTLFGYRHNPDTLKIKHFDDHVCKKLLFDVGAEDIATSSNGIAFITSGLVYAPFVMSDGGGKIYSMDLSKITPELIELALTGPHLNPHGLHIFEDDFGDVFLYVVNHGDNMSRETVEKYKVDKDHSGLTWLKTFADDEIFRNINDLNVIAEDEFYISNNFHAKQDTPWLRKLETNSHMLFGSIAYCKGDNCELKTYPSLAFPNGVQKRGNELFVALSLANYMVVYEINPVNKDLTFKRNIALEVVHDNIWMNKKGDMYIGGGTNMGDHILHGKAIGSEIYKIPAGSYQAEQIYFDDGTEFRQCSIAVEWESHILMGSPGADFMICTRK